MALLAHTREGVVVRGQDLYNRWSAEMDHSGEDSRPAAHWLELPMDVKRAWNVLAHDTQETIARA